MEGIKTVVVDEDVFEKEKEREGYEVFREKVREGAFVCFQTKKDPEDPKGIPASDDKKTELDMDNDEGRPPKFQKTK
jgi:hypothetical protein